MISQLRLSNNCVLLISPLIDLTSYIINTVCSLVPVSRNVFKQFEQQINSESLSVKWKHFTVAMCYVFTVCCIFACTPPCTPSSGITRCCSLRFGRSEFGCDSVFSTNFNLNTAFLPFAFHISKNKKRKMIFLLLLNER